MKNFKQLLSETKVLAHGSKAHMEQLVREYGDAENQYVSNWEDYGANHQYTKRANDDAINKRDKLYHHFGHCLPSKDEINDDDDLYNAKKFTEKHYKPKAIKEESSEYEKAYDHHRAELKALSDNGFGHSLSGKKLPDGRVRSTVRKIVVAPNKKDEHYFYISHSHNNYTRKNDDVETAHHVVRDGVYSGEHFDPGPPKVLDNAKHESIHDAIKYNLSRIEDLKKNK